MRISAFHIDGFGIFTNVSVEDLPGGITIFYGQNEAGKSTCLEFLRVMLTGYPHKKTEVERLAPINGGTAGGSLSLTDINGFPEIKSLRLTRRPGSGCLNLWSENGTPVPPDLLNRIFGGVSQEVYRKVFGFSLGELEQFESLKAEEVRNVLYGASFSPGLNSPKQALDYLRDQKEKIYRQKGKNQPLNTAFANLEDLRQRTRDLLENSASYDGLCLEMEKKTKELEELRTHKNGLEEERRRLERKLNAWLHWEQWRLLKERLATMPKPENNVPEEAATRLARLEEARNSCERSVAARQRKLEMLKDRRENLVYNTALLAESAILRGLAERKNSYRQAYRQVDILKESVKTARAELEEGLAQLGSDWSCERIHNTDRSVFGRSELDKAATELREATLSHQAAMDYLAKVNHETEACGADLAQITAEKETLPHVDAILSDQEREQLRSDLARLSENRRLEPGRQKAVENAQAAFQRALTQAHLETPDDDRENQEENTRQPQQLLVNLLGKQAEALTKAQETLDCKERSVEAAQALRQAEENCEDIRRKLEATQDAWRLEGAPTREALDDKTHNLRSLRALAANIEAEKERLAELTGRIEAENAIRPGKNTFLLFLAFIFFAVAGAIFTGRWIFDLTSFTFTEGITIPLNLWAAYVTLACGVALLGGSMPAGKPEEKRRRRELAQLQGRREACNAHLAELEAQAGQLCQLIGVDSADPIILDATEMLLEREKEQYFHEERSRKDIERLEMDLKLASQKASEMEQRAQTTELELQQARRRWHVYMQNLGCILVPQPESAAAFFARAEAARLAWENVANAQKELDAIWEDLHILEKGITAMPPIAEKLEAAGGAMSLEEAAAATLDACREADEVARRRTTVEAALEARKGEMSRLQARQEEAALTLEKCGEILTKARQVWSKAVSGLGLGDDLDPETAREAFKIMEKCMAAEKKLTTAERELAQDEQELEALRKPLGEILQRLGREPKTDSAGQDWIGALDELLAETDQAVRLQNERASLDVSITAEENELGAETAALDAAKAKEEGFMKAAGVGNADELLRVVREQTERNKVAEDIKNLEITLNLAANGQDFASFVQSFEGESQEEQEKRLRELSASLDEISDLDLEKAKAMGELKERIKTLASTDELGRLRQEEAETEESIRRMAFAWGSLALAEGLVKKAKKVFENERQPEVIRAASDIFSEITNGHWRGIGASLDDNSHLNVLPPDGDPIDPDRLSRGAQEQIYLALRIAYIRNHLERNGPLPVIMDEILVNFDQARAERAARAFAHLATRHGQQIFYFTCHQWVIDTLRSVAPQAPLFTVENGNIRRS